MARTTLRISEPMPAPHRALLERQLLDAITDACPEFSDHCFDPRGYPVGVLQDELERFAARPTLARPR